MIWKWSSVTRWKRGITVKPVSVQFSLYTQLPPSHLTRVHLTFPSPPSLPSPFLLTRELQSEALLAGEEVCGELQADGVEGAVGVRGQHWATQLPQQDPSILGPIPNPEHVMDLLRVENQEMQTVKRQRQNSLEAMTVDRWHSHGYTVVFNPHASPLTIQPYRMQPQVAKKLFIFSQRNYSWLWLLQLIIWIALCSNKL